jgi:hypothetical protein
VTLARLRRLGVLLLLVAAPGAASAQEPTGATTPGGYVGAEHWAVRAAWRASELGLARSYMPAQRLVPLTMVEEALREAAETAALHSPGVQELAEEWYARFQEEFPVRAGGAHEAASFARLRSASAGVGLVSRTGRVAPGLGEFPNHTGSDPLGEMRGATAGAEGAVSLGSHVSVQVASRFEPGELDLPVADLGLTAGPWSLSIGRQAVGYGWGRGGGVILSGAEPFNRVELATTRPIRPLPVGPISLHFFFSRLSEERHEREPYFWGARGVWRPHPRFDLAVQRAAMFGGHGVTITARRLGNMLIGRVVSVGFENQIVSAAGRFRLPSEALLPLTLYTEWGAEDAAGAWRDTPGYVVGVETPALPGVPQLALGLEYASFAGSCCGNPPWYRHHAFPGSWAGDDAPLGHPLGGNGTELLAHAGADLLDARLRLGTRAFRRNRREENLFVPGRAGRSTGMSAELTWRQGTRSELAVAFSGERGDGWRESDLRVGGRLLLGN